MLDQQNNLYTSNSKEKKRYLITYSLWFFIPILFIYGIVEVLVLNIPTNYKANSSYFNESKNEIELIALGSSQMDGAINPEFLDKPAICLASSSQHHNLDFIILQQLSSSTTNLKYVVLELSNSHLELPHNSKSFWKNAVYLKYYNVNAFERKTYFKDKLIYIANPDLYSRMLNDYYLKDNYDIKLNKFGYQTNSFNGSFPLNDFNEDIISKLITTPNQKENPNIFKNNTAYLFSMLDYISDRDLKVIICTLPLYTTYTKNLNINIVKRRDSVISIIKNKYPNSFFIEAERDTINFNVTDFNNANHLNPNGAKKFTLLLNKLVNKLD
jgi:hypothetical protein